jgi:hypothetical protein
VATVIINASHQLVATGSGDWQSQSPSIVYTALFIKVTFYVIVFLSNAILLVNVVPFKAVLDTVNRVAVLSACLCRAFGHTISGFIHLAGLRMGYNGFI